MRNLLLTLSLCCGCMIASASPSRVSGAQYLELAAKACRQQQADSLDYFLRLAQQGFQQQDSLIAWIDGIKDIARIYRDELLEPAAAVTLLQKANLQLLWRKPQQSKEWEAIGWLAVNLAYTYKYGLEEYLAASKHYQQAKAILVDQLGQEDLDIAVYIYQEWGNLKTMMGDFAMAQVLLDQFLAIALAEKDYNTAAEAYNDQGVQFISQWDISKERAALEKAITYLKEGLQLPSLHNFPKGLLHGNLVKCYRELGDRKAVMQHAQLADAAIQAFYDQSGYAGLRLDQAKIKQNLGDFLLDTGDLTEAHIQYEQAAALYLEIYPSAKHRELARTFSSHAEVFAQQKDWDKALAYHQRALTAIVGEFETETQIGNPDLNQIRAERVIGEVLLAKARTLQARYQDQNQLDDLKLALDCHDLLYEVEWRIRASYVYEASKLEHISKQQIVTEEGIAMAYTLWQASQEPQYLDLALQLAERNKSILLLEAVRKARHDQLTTHSSGLQAADAEQLRAIAELEKEIYTAEEHSAPDSVLRSLQADLLDLKQAYRNWMESLGEKRPGLLALGQNQAHPIAFYQEALVPQQSLLEYFVGQEAIYVFLISQTEKRLLQLPKDFPLEEWVSSFRLSIENFQMSGHNLQELCEHYSALGHQLHQKLIAPLQEYLKKGSQLLIIPNGILNYLPFEALLSKAESSCQFGTYPYLIRDYEVAYTYSGELYLELLRREPKNGEFVGFAPAFDGKKGFGKLYRNQESIQIAQQYMDGQIFLREEATIEQFKALAPENQVIHLATHAQANQQAGDFSFIIFSDGMGGFDSLYTRDLYLLALDAEMVLLSACETAVGRLHQGEGIISLARGFLFAGARSVVTTLWQINDEANYKLTELLYQELRTGQRKSAALRQAKLKHLKQSDNMGAHPVYWAAYISLGNQRPLEHHKLPYLSMLLGLPLGLVSWWAWRRRASV